MTELIKPDGRQRVFCFEDWLAAALSFLFSCLFYFYHMSPEVTFQDSGELVTAAFNFGVPHCPGYPLWTCLGFVWSHWIVPIGNPAWRVGTMSVITGGLAVGVMTMMMTASGRVLLKALPWADAVSAGLRCWITVCLGIGTALLYGLNRGVWLWACVPEMRILNVLSFMLISCLLFAWMHNPGRRLYLYAVVLVLGLSMANHQTVILMVAPITVGVLAIGVERWLSARRQKKREFRGVMCFLDTFLEVVTAILLCAAIIFAVFSWLAGSSDVEVGHKRYGLYAAVSSVCGIALLLGGLKKGWLLPRRALACVLLFMSGCSVYLYMPLAASTNPPMNFGYTATRSGFLHAVTRAQYGQLNSLSLFSREFFLNIWLFVKALAEQYSIILCLFAVVSMVALFVYWGRLKPEGRSWLIVVWTAFFVTGFGLLVIINPQTDRHEQNLVSKFFAPSHGIFAMLIGYGLTIVISRLAISGLSKWVVRLTCVALLALPVVTYKRNWPSCALRHNDYGYQFGRRIFEPGGGYEPMEDGTILFSGTDPVPVYMVFCESQPGSEHPFRDAPFDRSDIYVIIQDVLGDVTYLSALRDQYDPARPANAGFLQRHLRRDTLYPAEAISAPGAKELQMANRLCLQRNITGKSRVLAVNGMLSQWIFERNNNDHAFYVWESDALDWMVPYLRPYGMIMKIEKTPLASPGESPELWSSIVSCDKAYWDALCAECMARSDFFRNTDTRKYLAKLRSAIARHYAFRGLLSESQYAFRQAIELCPESPAASFLFAELLSKTGRSSEARIIMENYLKQDPLNSEAIIRLNSIKGAN